MKSFFEAGNVKKISFMGDYCMHFYFQQSPESPNGKRLVYNSIYPDGIDIIISNVDGNDLQVVDRLVVDIEKNKEAVMHQGATSIWIDNHRVAYYDIQNKRIIINNVDDKSRAEHEGGIISEYWEARKSIVFDTNSQDGILSKGIYLLNPDTGENTRVLSIFDLKKFEQLLEVQFDEERWTLYHPYGMADGKHIVFRLSVPGTNKKDKDYVVYSSVDGMQKHIVGLKPMHFYPYDNNSIVGHDCNYLNDKSLRRFNLQNEAIEVIAGYGCHGALSPDLHWIATESWYGSDPIVLRLYQRGSIEPEGIIYVQPNEINGIDFWKNRTHMHPAWSRDGYRVYFNAIGNEDKGVQVYVCDLTEYINTYRKVCCERNM